jgi:uncharacterized protein YbjQ (UPF0145 family)
MNNNSTTAAPGSAAVTSARQFAAQAEAAIADLEERVPAGMGPLERALAERLRTALARLIECAEQLQADGLMVVGSTRQRRPHQLLKTEAELRREVAEGLQQLTFRAEQGAMFARAQARRRKRGQCS